MKTKEIPLKNSLYVLLTATIWGIAFVAQSVGMEYLGPFTFNSVRCLIGGAVLLPLIWVREKKAVWIQASDTSEQKRIRKKNLVSGGICCGLLLFLASNFQQFGIQYTTVGKAGFITACYIVIVPVLGLFLGKNAAHFFGPRSFWR